MMNHGTSMIYIKVVSKIFTRDTYKLRPGNKSKW